MNGKKRPLLGAFMPQCNEDGSYKEVQCHGSTGYCWCVDKNGNKKEGTEVRSKRPKCGKGMQMLLICVSWKATDVSKT